MGIKTTMLSPIFDMARESRISKMAAAMALHGGSTGQTPAHMGITLLSATGSITGVFAELAGTNIKIDVEPS
jgi:hypothetical protein